MKYKLTLPKPKIFSVFLLAFVTLSTSVTKADLALLLNTRESRSVLVSKRDIKAAKKWLPTDNQATARLEATFRIWAKPLEAGRELCEVDVLQGLEVQLQKDGWLKKGNKRIIPALVLFRQKGWIDDVVLAPLLSTAVALHSMTFADTASEDLNSSTENLSESESLRLKIFKDLSSCPNEAYRTVVTQIKRLKRGKLSRFKLKRWIRRAHNEKLISVETRSQLLALANAKYDRVPRKLSSALDEMKSAKLPNRPGEEGATAFVSERSSGHRFLSRRMSMYARFSGLQIVLLSETFKKFKNRISAKSAEIVIHYESAPDEIYRLSPLEQYRMAVKMLHKEIIEMKLSTLFEGKKVEFEDLIVAGLETGEIAASDIEAVMKVDDLWNPDVPGWKKVYNYAKLIGFPMLIFIPPPYNIIASTIVVLSEALLMPKDPVSADDAGVSIF